MIIIVYSETNSRTIAKRIGRSEYSYYFVLQSFRPLLEKLGVVVEVDDPERQVDGLWANARSLGEDCIFLSFTPPHKTLINLKCPTIPVFAWEFDTIPDEVWDGEARHDWTSVIKSLGQAIVHSSNTVATVRRALGRSVNVSSVPAPVWDRYASFRGKSGLLPICGRRASFTVEVPCVDSRTVRLDGYDRSCSEAERFSLAAAHFTGQKRGQAIELDGIVYTAVLNPFDSRKRLWDMMSHFVWAFRDRPDATLLLKTTHADLLLVMVAILGDLVRLRPFKCRILVIHGLVPQETYDAIIRGTTYVLNCSAGEGQCLPLMEFLSCGIPAIAPRNSAMADYITERNSFIVASHPEPTSWPQDTRQLLRTLRERVDYYSLMVALQKSFVVARCEKARYQVMSSEAVEALRQHCSDVVILDRLRELIQTPASSMKSSRSSECLVA